MNWVCFNEIMNGVELNYFTTIFEDLSKHILEKYQGGLRFVYEEVFA